MDKLLNFKGMGLTQFPDEILRQKQITNLNLENNRISKIPEWIEELTDLKVLYLSGNAIEDIHPLTTLTNLEVLHLNSNCISRIPDTVANWPHLKRLFISGNRLSRLPGSLGLLKQLKFFLAANNNIESIAQGFFSLPNLETLDLFNNRLAAISENLCQLKRLDYLQLSMNQIDHLPESIGQNLNIITLSAFSNKLKRIPSQLIKLSNLKYLNVGDNNIEKIEFVPYSISRLSIYANPVEHIDPQLLDGFRDASGAKDGYIYVDILQANDFDLQKSDFGDRLKIIDLASGKIHWTDHKNMPQALISKWGLERSR